MADEREDERDMENMGYNLIKSNMEINELGQVNYLLH
jgi:hypothetical protein